MRPLPIVILAALSAAPSFAEAKPLKIEFKNVGSAELYLDGVPLDFSDSELPLLVPKPPVAPASVTIYQDGFGDAQPYPRGILLVTPPIRFREPVIVFGQFDDNVFGIRVTVEDAFDPLPWIAGGLLGAGLMAFFARRRHHPIGEIV